MENSIVGKWMYNINGNEIWSGEEFNTKEEAVKEGLEEAKTEGCFKFEVGQIEKVTVSGVDIDYILENVAENTTEDCGEVGEDYLNDVTKEDRDELEQKFNDLLFSWIKEHGYEPSFFKIKNVKTIRVD